MEDKDLQKYQEHYSEQGLWSKIASVAKAAGVKVIYVVLLLVYVLKSSNTSKKDKSIIYGALGYFILPADVIPDFIPGVGFADDLTALVLALKAVWVNVTPEVKEQARQRLTSWFGDVNQSDLTFIDK